MNGKYTIFHIQRYLQGELSPQEMYELEKEALDDPFLNDAIEGYRLQQGVNYGKLSLLQQRLINRIDEQRKEREQFFSGGQRLGIAATACVLFVLIVVLFWMKNSLNSADQHVESLSEVEVDLNELAGQSGLRVVPMPGVAQSEALVPVGGWDSFNAYLNANFVFSPDQDNVQLLMLDIEFRVSSEGKPMQIVVSEAGTADTHQMHAKISQQQQQAIIGLIQNGPLWQGGSEELVRLSMFLK